MIMISEYKFKKRMQSLAGLDNDGPTFLEKILIKFEKIFNVVKCFLSLHSYVRHGYDSVTLRKKKKYEILYSVYTCFCCGKMKLVKEVVEEDWKKISNRMEKFLEPLSKERVLKLKAIISESHFPENIGSEYYKK